MALLSVSMASAVNITFRVTVPEGTPPGDKLTIGANFNGWNPADPASVMTRGTDGVWTLKMSFKEDQHLEFKITRGGWNTVEKNPDGSEMQNRVFDVVSDATIDIKVAAWADLKAAASPKSTVTGTLKTLNVKLPKLNVARDALVWLPPGYDTATKRYPVVYMLDGQNVFDAATSFVGQEWQADEAATELAKSGQEMIIVALNNGGKDRTDEYTVNKDTKDGGGRGADTLADIVSTLKPAVDKAYRTQTDAKHTALVGSSLGGLLALNGGLSYPDTFGFVGVLSPSVGWAGGAALKDAAGAKAAAGQQFILTTGDKEASSAADNQAQVTGTRNLQAALQKAGAKADLIVTPGAGHNEAAWAARLPDLLKAFWKFMQ